MAIISLVGRALPSFSFFSSTRLVLFARHSRECAPECASEFSKGQRNGDRLQKHARFHGKRATRAPTRWTMMGKKRNNCRGWWRRYLIRTSCDWPGYCSARRRPCLHLETFSLATLCLTDASCGRHFRAIMRVACDGGYKVSSIASRSNP